VQAGNSKDAIPLYRRALEQTPADPIVHQDLGVAFLQQADIQDAINEFQRLELAQRLPPAAAPAVVPSALAVVAPAWTSASVQMPRAPNTRAPLLRLG